MLKLNKLFYTTTRDVYHDVILPTSEQQKFLRDSRNEIRDYLRPRIKAATVAVLQMERPVEPKFRDQGSWSYRTCIQPAYMPIQQMDWDFGVYLPVSVWEDNGPPHLMAKAYFHLVENLLDQLCKDKGWKLFTGKDNCIRVEIANWAHIDLPLYAAPEAQFEELTEKAAAQFNESKMSLDSIELLNRGEMFDQSWDDIDGIFMATRLGEWKKSDPYAVTRWFKDRILEQGSHGEQLRRVCCYLKGWRDFQWKTGKSPSSLLIMLCVVQDFQGILGRDDLVLEEASKRLSQLLLSDVYCKALDGGLEDFNCLETEDRFTAASLARNLYEKLNSARKVHFNSAHLSIQMITEMLGDRVPDKTYLVEPDSGADEIRNTSAIIVPPPLVLNNKAG